MPKTVEFKFDLGDRVRDAINGFEGIVVARTDYMTGCQHFGVKPQTLAADGKSMDWEYVDGTYLELVPAEPVRRTGTGGGPAPDPPQM